MNDFAPRLIAWQARHGRHDLPWQQDRDAYRIWLSEIMLQQTQVGTVIPYYLRFLARCPDIASLALAPESEVLGLWSGLGYYARARNLHKAAKVVMSRHGGVFPRHSAAIGELPGIGRSTAAAIAAFAFGERAAILDGNVKRVFTRCFGVAGFPGEKAVELRLWALAEELLPHDGVDAYIQGLMDLGATLCTRSKPACPRCPMADICVANLGNRVAELPTRRPKKTVPQRHARLLVLMDAGRVLLEQRPPTGIWGGLLSLPELPDECTDPAAWVADHLGCGVAGLQPLTPFQHTFTHFRLEIMPLLGEVSRHLPVAHQDSLTWLGAAELPDAPLPAPIRKILTALLAPHLL